jgi:hypothetical protein
LIHSTQLGRVAWVCCGDLQCGLYCVDHGVTLWILSSIHRGGCVRLGSNVADPAMLQSRAHLALLLAGYEWSLAPSMG